MGPVGNSMGPNKVQMGPTSYMVWDPLVRNMGPVGNSMGPNKVQMGPIKLFFDFALKG
jgi:hypothetical protein